MQIMKRKGKSLRAHSRMWTEFVILQLKMLGAILLMRHEFYMEGTHGTMPKGPRAQSPGSAFLILLTQHSLLNK